MTEASLEALYEAETSKTDHCFFARLPPDAQEFVRAKVAEAKEKDERIPWAALGRTLLKAGYEDAAKAHALSMHFMRAHE